MCPSTILPGSPLPPHPQVEVMSTTELKVTWEEPFTFESFPILDYNITVYNSSEPNNSRTYTVTDRSKHITIDTETTACSLLRFNVTARNEIERSRIGTTSGGFPVGEFMQLLYLYQYNNMVDMLTVVHAIRQNLK